MMTVVAELSSFLYLLRVYYVRAFIITIYTIVSAVSYHVNLDTEMCLMSVPHVCIARCFDDN